MIITDAEKLVTYLKLEDIAALQDDIRYFSYEELHVLATKHPDAMKNIDWRGDYARKVATMNAVDFANLPMEDFEKIVSKEGLLGLHSLNYLTNEQLDSIKTDQIRSISNEALDNNEDSKFIVILNRANKNHGFSIKQIKNLQKSQLMHFKATHLSSLSVTKLHAFSYEQIVHISESEVQESYAPTALIRMENTKEVTEIQERSKEEMRADPNIRWYYSIAIFGTRINDFTAAQMGKLIADQFNRSPEAIALVDVEKIKEINQSIIEHLSSELIKSITGSQWQNFSPAQIEMLTAKQLWVLEGDAKYAFLQKWSGDLNAKQKIALLSNAKAALLKKEDLGQSGEYISSVKNLSSLDAELIRSLDQEYLSKIDSDQFSDNVDCKKFIEILGEEQILCLSNSIRSLGSKAVAALSPGHAKLITKLLSTQARYFSDAFLQEVIRRYPQNLTIGFIKNLNIGVNTKIPRSTSGPNAGITLNKNQCLIFNIRAVICLSDSAAQLSRKRDPMSIGLESRASQKKKLIWSAIALGLGFALEGAAVTVGARLKAVKAEMLVIATVTGLLSVFGFLCMIAPLYFIGSFLFNRSRNKKASQELLDIDTELAKTNECLEAFKLRLENDRFRLPELAYENGVEGLVQNNLPGVRSYEITAANLSSKRDASKEVLRE